MTIDKIIPWLISIVSVIFSIWTASKKNTKEDTATIATIVTKLESIEKGVNNITQENKDLRNIVNDLMIKYAPLSNLDAKVGELQIKFATLEALFKDLKDGQ